MKGKARGNEEYHKRKEIGKRIRREKTRRGVESEGKRGLWRDSESGIEGRRKRMQCGNERKGEEGEDRKIEKWWRKE